MDTFHAQMASLSWYIADDVLMIRRIHRSDNFLYREYNQNEGIQDDFSKLLRRIIDDQDYREVVYTPERNN